ncbi:MAG: Crp/Fnr family transcriptional regulator [Thermoleophilia bacterium]
MGEQAGVSPVCLAHLWLFHDLSEAEAAALTAAAWRKPFEKGQYVFIQGEPATLLFVIKAGRVKLVKTDEDGTEILVDMRKAGDFIGETFLSAEADYPLTAECVEDSLLCGFTRERFERLVTENPHIGLQIMRNMSERIHWLTSRVGSRSSTHLEERLYAVLTTVAREHGTRTEGGLVIEFPLTHEELSFLVGAHRVSVTKALKALRESGKVTQEGRRLVLPTG